MAYCEHLSDRVRQIFNENGVEFIEKKMMGGLCFMVDGKMCVGINDDELMARIGPHSYESALEKSGCREMDFTGRPMVGFVFVESAAIESKPKLRSWLKLALAFNPEAQATKKRRKK